MEVIALFYGHLRKLAGKKDMVVHLPEGSSLQNLVDKLGEEFGEELSKEVQSGIESDFPLMVYVGTKDYRFNGGWSMKLEDRTSIYFIPPAIGG